VLVWALVCNAVLVFAAPAPASATDFTWSGAGSVGASNWSNTANWEGGSAPSGTVGKLSFPALSSGGCATNPPTSACYNSDNDLNGLNVKALSIDDSVGYFITGSAITLGAGGLATAPFAGDKRQGSPDLGVPIELGAPQTWTITGGTQNQQLFVADVMGEAHALAIKLAHSTALNFGSAEVGAVTVSGDGSFNGLALAGSAEHPAALNATDGNPVSLSGGAGLFAVHGAIGPLTMSGGGQLSVGEGSNPPGPETGAGELIVKGGVSLASTSTFQPTINQPGEGAGDDYSQLSATGNVSLGSAHLNIGAANFNANVFTCQVLTPGDQATLVTATGSLSGTFNGVPNGATVQADCPEGSGIPPTMRIDYTAHAVIATVVGSGNLTHTLTTSVTGKGSGTITGTGIHCPGSCSQSYAAGTKVTLTATPGSSSTFEGWSGGGCSGKGKCTVTLNADRSVSANFAPFGGLSPPATTCADNRYTVGPFTVEAACFTRRGDKLIAKGRVRVNGVDVVPDGSGSITVDTRALTLTASGEVNVYLGPIRVYHHALSWKLQGQLKLALPDGVKVKGLPIGGDLALAPAKGGIMDVTANAAVASITGYLHLKLTNSLGLQIQDAKLSWEGGLPIKQLVVKNASLAYHHSSAGDEWTGKVSVVLPFPGKLPNLDGTLAILNGQVAEVGLTASNINRPVGEVVFLQKLGLDVRVVPHFKATGTLGLSAGPTLPILNAPAASLDSTLTADLGDPVVLSAKGNLTIVGKLPLAEATAKWTVPSRFQLSGEAKISAGPASVDARVSGIVSSKGFALLGNGAVSVPGASGSGLVYFSEKGFGACFLESVGPTTVGEGFGEHWTGGFPDLWVDSCGLDAYKSAAGGVQGRAQVSAAGESIRVAAGEEQVLIGARGVSDFPAFTVESPSGQVIDPANGVSGPVDAGGYRFVSDPPRLGTYVILAHPKAGTWRIVPEPSSPQIASFGSARGARPVKVTAHVSHRAGKYVLRWHTAAIPGETIRFEEVSPRTARTLKTTSQGSGSLRFGPAIDGSEGKRKIEALVSVDGLPRKILTATTFRVPRPPAPGRVRGLRIEKRGRRALLRWKPSPRARQFDLRVALSDGRHLFFRLPAHAHSLRVPLLFPLTRVSATIRPIAADGRQGPRARTTARL
jgi:hypothetical protein